MSFDTLDKGGGMVALPDGLSLFMLVLSRLSNSWGNKDNYQRVRHLIEARTKMIVTFELTKTKDSKVPKGAGSE